MYNTKKITTHKLLHRFFREKFSHDIIYYISKFVGKYTKILLPKKWVRIKLPREKRLIRVYY